MTNIENRILFPPITHDEILADLLAGSPKEKLVLNAEDFTWLNEKYKSNEI